MLCPWFLNIPPEIYKRKKEPILPKNEPFVDQSKNAKTNFVLKGKSGPKRGNFHDFFQKIFQNPKIARKKAQEKTARKHKKIQIFAKI